MVDIARFFLDFTVDESCGKCTPCRDRHPAHAGDSGTHRGGQGRGWRHRKAGRPWPRTSRTTALCGLGQTAPNPVLSTLRYFRDEYEAHIKEKRCPAGSLPGAAQLCASSAQVPRLHPVRQGLPGWAPLPARCTSSHSHRCTPSASSAAPAWKSASFGAICKEIIVLRRNCKWKNSWSALTIDGVSVQVPARYDRSGGCQDKRVLIFPPCAT